MRSRDDRFDAFCRGSRAHLSGFAQLARAVIDTREAVMVDVDHGRYDDFLGRSVSAFSSSFDS